ncbi:MAG: hypothetical protein HBSAPP03_01110 [Phycisphaerae bacterium]|nr:MAG: hypothetical protein HBSAPP03_01110 [Phycisphaerae bacterium]
MSDSRSKPGATLGACLASLILAGALGTGAYFLIVAAVDTTDVLTNGGKRPTGSLSLGFLWLLAVVVGLGALVFLGVAVATAWRGLHPKPEPQETEEDWKRFPAPKDG